LDCSVESDPGTGQSLAGFYLPDTLKAGQAIVRDILTTAPVVEPAERHAVFPLSLLTHEAAASLITAGSRIDVWCGGVEPAIEDADVLAVQCAAPSMPARQCEALLEVPRSLRLRLTDVSPECRIFVRASMEAESP
jgi:hypothetical protein